MKVKVLELRDIGTFIPLLCVDMNAEEVSQRYLLRRCGYPCDNKPNIAITRLAADGDRCSNDPYYWCDRTRATAHKYIIEHWNELADGDVVDVEWILGERDTPKLSERETD